MKRNMLTIIALALLATACNTSHNAKTAQTGYRYCISNSAGFRCHNTLSSTQALDSITPVCNTPGSVIMQHVEAHKYYLSETAAWTVYLEQKRFAGYKNNGEIKLRRY